MHKETLRTLQAAVTSLGREITDVTDSWVAVDGVKFWDTGYNWIQACEEHDGTFSASTTGGDLASGRTIEAVARMADVTTYNSPASAVRAYFQEEEHKGGQFWFEFYQDSRRGDGSFGWGYEHEAKEYGEHLNADIHDELRWYVVDKVSEAKRYELGLDDQPPGPEFFNLGDVLYNVRADAAAAQREGSWL